MVGRGAIAYTPGPWCSGQERPREAGSSHDWPFGRTELVDCPHVGHDRSPEVVADAASRGHRVTSGDIGLHSVNYRRAQVLVRAWTYSRTADGEIRTLRTPTMTKASSCLLTARRTERCEQFSNSAASAIVSNRSSGRRVAGGAFDRRRVGALSEAAAAICPDTRHWVRKAAGFMSPAFQDE